MCLSCATVIYSLPKDFVDSLQNPTNPLSVRPQLHQLSLDDLRNEPVQIERTEVHVIEIATPLLARLVAAPDEIYRLTPVEFEEFIGERLTKIGFDVQAVGSSTFHKDGGIDLIACKSDPSFPFMVAVQIKHHSSPHKKTGANVVRDMLGVVHHHHFNAGVVVTNTSFTADAKWVAAQNPWLIQLKDITSIRKWLLDNILDDFDWREVPQAIEVCPGLWVPIPGCVPRNP